MGIFSGGQGQVKTKANLNKFQRQLNRFGRKAVKSYIKKTKKGGPGIDLPKTALVQPFTPPQTQGQSMMLGAVPQLQNLANAGASYTTNLLSQNPATAGQAGALARDPGYDQQARDFLLNKVLYPGTNPALQGAINAAVRPITQQLTEEQLPALRGNAVTAGGYGGSRQGIAEGLASGRASTAIGDTSANLANAGYQAGLNALTQTFGNITAADTARYGTRQGALSNLYNTNVNAQLNALGLLPQTQQTALAPALATSAVGDVQQAQLQAERDEDVYRKLFSQTSPLQSAQSLVQLGGAVPGGSTTSTTQYPGTNPVLGSLGIASGVAGLIPGLPGMAARGVQNLLNI